MPIFPLWIVGHLQEQVHQGHERTPILRNGLSPDSTCGWQISLPCSHLNAVSLSHRRIQKRAAWEDGKNGDPCNALTGQPSRPLPSPGAPLEASPACPYCGAPPCQITVHWFFPVLPYLLLFGGFELFLSPAAPGGTRRAPNRGGPSACDGRSPASSTSFWPSPSSPFRPPESLPHHGRSRSSSRAFAPFPVVGLAPRGLVLGKFGIPQ